MDLFHKKYLKYKAKYIYLKMKHSGEAGVDNAVNNSNQSQLTSVTNTTDVTKMNILQAEEYVRKLVTDELVLQASKFTPHINILRKIKPTKLITSFETKIYEREQTYFKNVDFIYTMVLNVNGTIFNASIKYSWDGHTDYEYHFYGDKNIQYYEHLYGWTAYGEESRSRKQVREKFIKNIKQLKFNTFSYAK